jgi:hypothetical protein
MNRSYSKIRHIQESNQRLEKRFLVEESTSNKNTLSEQTTTSFAAAFPSVNMLTSKDVRTQPFMGGNDNTNIIYLTKRDANGKPIPNTKFSYKLKGKYGFVPFNITLRKVTRDTTGKLFAEALPDSGLVRKAMQKLIGGKLCEDPKNMSKCPLTQDGWLKIVARPEQINSALTQLHQNKGSKATIELDGGVDVTLELIQP